MSLARLTLDTTTVAAYALGSEDVGEVHVLTTEPDAYGEGIETIPIGE